MRGWVDNGHHFTEGNRRGGDDCGGPDVLLKGKGESFLGPVSSCHLGTQAQPDLSVVQQMSEIRWELSMFLKNFTTTTTHQKVY